MTVQAPTASAHGATRRPLSLLPIVVGNGIPLAGVLLLHWSVYALITAFWIEALAVGLFSAVEISKAARDDPPDDPGTGRFIPLHGPTGGPGQVFVPTGGGVDQIYIPGSGDAPHPENVQAELDDYGSGWSRFYRLEHAAGFLVGFLVAWSLVGLAVNAAYGPASNPHGHWVLFPLAWPTVMGGISAVWVALWLATQLVTHFVAYRRDFVATEAWKRLRPGDIRLEASWHLMVLAAVTVFPAFAYGSRLSVSTAALLLLVACKTSADLAKWRRIRRRLRV